MAPLVVGSGTLRRLSELNSDGRPVLSVYLDTDVGRCPTAATREGQLRALMAGVGPGARQGDVNRVREMLLSIGDLAYGARGLAMFSCAEGSVFETVPLPGPVDAMAVVDTQPWLEPLAGMFTPGDWGVAVLGRCTARMFRGCSRALIEFAAVHDGLHRRDAPGDSSQSRSQQPIEEHIAEHTRRVSALLVRAHRRRPFDQLVVAAPNELWPSIEDTLHSDLHDRLAGLVALELEHAPAPEIARAVAPIVQRAEREETEHSRCSTITASPVRGQRTAAHETTTRYLQRLPGALRVARGAPPPVSSRAPRESRKEHAICP